MLLIYKSELEAHEVFLTITISTAIPESRGHPTQLPWMLSTSGTATLQAADGPIQRIGSDTTPQGTESQHSEWGAGDNDGNCMPLHDHVPPCPVRLLA